MKMDCKVDVKLCVERVDSEAIKVSVFVNKEFCFDWHILLEKFQTEKVLVIQEDL